MVSPTAGIVLEELIEEQGTHEHERLANENARRGDNDTVGGDRQAGDEASCQYRRL